MGIRSAQVSELVFENCEIPETALLGEEKQGFKIAMKTLDGGRIGEMCIRDRTYSAP